VLQSANRPQIYLARIPEIPPHPFRGGEWRNCQRACRLVLQVETQKVVIAPHMEMKPAADRMEKVRCLRDFVDRFPDGLMPRSEPRKPAQKVNIANAAWRLLNVRFQVINRVVEFGVPLASQFGERSLDAL